MDEGRCCCESGDAGWGVSKDELKSINQITEEKKMNELRYKIVEEIRRDAYILDTRLAQYFERNPLAFHEEIKKNTSSEKYTFYGLLGGDRGSITWKWGETEYENPMLGGVRPFTEACILTKENIINDLKEIFPQYRNQIEELIELVQ